MGKICVIVLIALSLICTLCGCEEVVLTSCDELVYRNWYTENISGVGATLEFSENSAVFTVTEDKNAVAVISGTLAVDSNKFYITSDDLACTYEFGYEVFADRANITYNGETLVFYPVENSLSNGPKSK